MASPTRKLKGPKSGLPGETSTPGVSALAAYKELLREIEKNGSPVVSKRQARAIKPLFIHKAPAIARLCQTLSAVAPAFPGAPDEEWNPLSQRPHAPLPVEVGSELGAEVTALKEAVDSFTTFSHEVMHVALWEPFFTGRWCPKNFDEFRLFSLMAEGYCFFYADILVSGTVRVAFPNGEFAQQRRTPSNGRFHPIQAFHAAGIKNHHQILDIYLLGFAGEKTALDKKVSKSPLTAAFAGQSFAFFSGSQSYLKDLYEALYASEVFTEFYERFASIENLPTFYHGKTPEVSGVDQAAIYFRDFYKTALSSIDEQSAATLERVRFRRSLQTRAYGALQVRWLLGRQDYFGQPLTPALRRPLLNEIEIYLGGVQHALQSLANDPTSLTSSTLMALDERYDRLVRRKLMEHDLWTGHRWLIAPKRAGGSITTRGELQGSLKSRRIKILMITAFLIDELTRSMRTTQTIEERMAIIEQIAELATLGKRHNLKNAASVRRTYKRLQKQVQRPQLRRYWALPLAAFDPKSNRFRELLFSYQ